MAASTEKGVHQSDNAQAEGSTRRLDDAGCKDGDGAEESIPPGIDYSLSACAGRWAYMNDEGTSHITKGYRIGLSVGQCIKSMFQIHNETVNVWSHLAGFLLFVCLCISVLSSPALSSTKATAQESNLCLGVSPYGPRVSVSSSSSQIDEKCIREEEQDAWRNSHDQFEAAKAILQHAKGKLPGLKQWREVLELHTMGVRKEVAAEARALQEKLDQAVAMLDTSVEKIKEDLAYLSNASMEGCISCWAELVSNLNRSRETLMEQLASVSKMSTATLKGTNAWGLSPAEWAEYTAVEIKSITNSLNGGISAARKALAHASGHMPESLQRELNGAWQMSGILPSKEIGSGLSRWPIVVFLMSACICLFTSALYHLFNCHSRKLNDVLLLLDYVGISVLIAGSFYPPIYYGFYCRTHFVYLYLGAVTVISVTSAIVGVYSGLNPSKFWRWARVLCYSANACFGILPCGHLSALYFSGDPSWGPAIAYIAAMLGIYGVGTCIYTYQFPERYFPGKFDYFLSSHQLWHILVFAAAFLHYFCAIGHYQWRAYNTCEAVHAVPVL